MKQIFILIAAAFVVVSCCSKPEAGVAKGVVFDASMNNVMVITAAGDTLTFSTMALADSGKMIGVFVNDTIEVAYSPIDGGDQPNYYKADDVKLLWRSPFYYLVGEWTEPNPIDSTAVQGFIFNDDNSARSVNMATLECSRWSYDAGKLTLTMTSIGNKETNTSDEVYDVVTLDGDSLVLSQNGNIVWSLSHAK